jgi:hypothetical protein
MSRDWWSPDLGGGVHRRGDPAGGGGGGVAIAGGPGPRGRSFGDELGTDDRDLAGGVDAQPDLASFQPDDRHADVVADKEFFHQLPRQHQHGTVPRLP